MIKNTLRKFKEKLGYSLMEMLIVIGVIAVTIGIATPAVTSFRRSQNLTQGNEYAKAIYMAAQNNLTQMRSMGELIWLHKEAAEGGYADCYSPVNNCDAGSSYRCFLFDKRTMGNYGADTESRQMQSCVLVSPVAPETGHPAQQIIVEFHPKAGIVYSVFYYEGNKDLEDLYTDQEDNELIRGLSGTEKERKKLGVGYYCVGDVDALEDQAFDVYHTSASVSYENGQKGMLVVDVPIVDKKGDNMFPNADYEHYKSGLEIVLTVTGENGGEYTETITSENTKATFTPKITQNLLSVEIPLDSLDANAGFAANPLNQPDGGSGNLIAPGDNISVTAEVTFYPSKENDPLIVVESATIAGINPMFHSLTQNPDHNEAVVTSPKPYILAVSNGRHLQNLSALDKVFANQIEAIVFTQPESGQGIALAADDLVLDWADTAAEYTYHKDLVPIDLSKLDKVPTIDGNGVEIRNLTVGADLSGNAGMFAKLKDTNIKNINLVNPTVNATTATATGALTGSAENATITNCNITNAPAAENGTMISGKTDVGGLVGYADKSKFADCTTGAIVLGTGMGNSNLGGLVGTSKASAFTDCEAISVSVTSAERSGAGETKNALGGLVGSAIAEGSTDSTFSDCSADSNTRITSAADSYSDLGGFVGSANGATFTSCKSSALAAGTVTGNGGIPNNNLGGFVGQSRLSDYSDITVLLNYLPQYAQDAGGFAALIHGCKVNGLVVTIPETANAGTATVTKFGGIASQCGSGAKLSNAVFTSHITSLTHATDAVAGAIAYMDTCTISNVEINAMRMTAKQSAGFTIHAGSGANISDSYARGTMTVTTGNSKAGFAIQNDGIIDRCLTHVYIDNGDAFVGTNGGTVKNCYGVVWGENSAIAIPNKCSFSYFINGKSGDVVLYEALDSENKSTQSPDIRDTEALADELALYQLNNGKTTDCAWMSGNSGYPYPLLTSRNQPAGIEIPVRQTGSYSYALRYVDEALEVLMHYNADNQLQSVTKTPGTYSDTPGFYLCHRTSGDVGEYASVINYTATNFNDELAKFKLEGANKLYSIYKLNPNTYYKSGAVNTRYPLNGTDGSYLIRTGEQFANIESTGTFLVDRDITVSSSIPSFGGTLNGNSKTITASVPLVKKVTGGEIKNMKVTGGISGNGAVAEEVTGGSFSNVNSTATVTASDPSMAGMFAGSVSGGSFTSCTVTADNQHKLPFARFATETLSDVTHSYTQKLETGKAYLHVQWPNFTPVSTAPQTVTTAVTVSNCTINGANALVEGVHYYNVNTKVLLAELDTATSVGMVAVDPDNVTESLLDLAESSTAPVKTNYFVPTSGQNTYSRVYVSVQTELLSSETTTDPETNTSTTVNTYQYTFTFTDKNGATSLHPDVKTTSLDASADINLYSVEIPSNLSGAKRILKCDSGFLYCDGTTFGVAAQVPSDSDVSAFLWDSDDSNGWSCQHDDTPAVLSTTWTYDGTADSVASVIKIAGVNNTINTLSFRVINPSLYYPCTYKGTGSEVYIPS